jgi:cation transport regulator ChaC
MSLKRDSNEAKRAVGERFITDPEFQAFFGAEEQSIVVQIANYPSSGGTEKLLSLCRELQALTRVKRRMFSKGATLNDKQFEGKA